MCATKNLNNSSISNRIIQKTNTIQTTFPKLSGKAKCLVKEIAGVHLIQELIQFQPAQSLPIKSIYFKHPHFTKRYRVRVQKGGLQSVAGGVAVVPAPLTCWPVKRPARSQRLKPRGGGLAA